MKTGNYTRARASMRQTTPEQLEKFFAELKRNGANVSAAAKHAGLPEATGYYYSRKAADPRYANKKGISPETSEKSWRKQSLFDIRLNDLIAAVFTEVEKRLEEATLPELVKTQRELISLRRYVEAPPTKKEKQQAKEESAPPPEPVEDIETILARAAARKAKEKSLPLGDTTPEAPIEEARVEM